MFGKAEWIWLDKETRAGEYGDFFADFEYDGGKVSLKLCAETDYIVYLNGKMLFHGQFAGYKTEKYYDEEDITASCVNGKNTLMITVRYEGVDTFCHIEDGAGLIFSLENDGKQIVFSSEAIQSRLSPAYVGYIDRLITEQLGVTSTMTNRGEAAEPTPSRRSPRSMNFKKRPVKRCLDLAPVHGKPVDIEGRRIYDLGREDCGYAFLRVNCPAETNVKLAYGEHLDDGCVRYLIGKRDFSLDFECVVGENYFVQYFVRIAGRYLEIFADESVELLDVGIIPTIYPLTEKGCSYEGLDREIYDVSVRTLRLCMHTHYEDCPWREQAFYVLDSRNQMLFGYYAFEETEFQRENLIFASKGTREDGMLELTYPAVNTPAIPFFSVIYPVAVLEYVEHTGDRSIIPLVMPTMLSIMNRLYSWIDGSGLIVNQPKPYWNFYEWCYASEGRKGFGEAGTRDLIINCAFVYSYERLIKLCEMEGVEPPEYDVEAMRKAIVRTFYDGDKGVFRATEGVDAYTVLGNSFAMLIGIGNDRVYSALKSRSDLLVPATLSMLPYLYDAVLQKEGESGKDFILEDIRKNYSYMLSKGATSFWETAKGGDDFHKAGSLCHGWSGIPVYYFKKFI